MKRYLARGVGVVIGIPAGPAGVLFGFLIGALVDQYRKDAPTDAALDRYLSRPASERSDERALLYGSAVLAAAVIGTDSSDVDRRIVETVAMPWPGAETSARRVLRRRAVLARVIRRVVERRPIVFHAAIADDVARRISNDTAEQLLGTLLCVGTDTVSRHPEAQSRVQRVMDVIAEAFGVKMVSVGSECTGDNSLDREACRLLGVGPEVDREELRYTYRRLASQMHPDTGVSLDVYQQDELAGAFVRIRDAYERLLVQIEARDRYRHKT